MIGIIDYGLGNLKAFVNVYDKLNIKTVIVKNDRALLKCSKVILPGVGAFDQAIKLLDESGMRQTLDSMVFGNKVMILGVCVGMQILGRKSEEGQCTGLGYVDGSVKKINTKNIFDKTKLPHMGWNTISPIKNNDIFSGLNEKSRFYFLHSYYFSCNDKRDAIATTDYGAQLTCAINHGKIYGVQFHPEKSHSCGIKLLSNFALM